MALLEMHPEVPSLAPSLLPCLLPSRPLSLHHANDSHAHECHTSDLRDSHARDRRACLLALIDTESGGTFLGGLVLLRLCASLGYTKGGLFEFVMSFHSNSTRKQ